MSIAPTDAPEDESSGVFAPADSDPARDSIRRHDDATVTGRRDARQCQGRPLGDAMFKWLLVLATGLIVFHPIVYLAAKKVFFSSPWVSSNCDRVELASVDSLDLQWQAKAIQFGCGDGFASNDWVSIVVVKHGQRPSKEDELLEVSSQWNSGGRLEWQTGNNLQIYLPEGMSIDRYGPAAKRVTSEIRVGRYDP